MAEVSTWRHLREQLGYRSLLAGKWCIQRLPRASGARRHVFVAGMQRSGTNMLMDLIERSMLTDVYHERDPRAFDNYMMRELPVIRRLAEQSRAPHFVIKCLCELDQLPALMDEFQPSKALWIVREYRDAVNSALVSFGRFKQQIERIATDKAGDEWFARGMSDDTTRLVRSVWHPDMSEADAAALIWYFRNLLFFQLGLDRRRDVKLLSYEALVTQPALECEQAFRFVDLPYTPFITRKVFATSISKKAPPPISGELVTLCDGLMQRFQAQREATGG
ncbi:sulfotransferase domain-containing protein [Methyloversatilis thermotolerans]|uniref:sulfotransferase domain-containing protein n=1 Tax=Methyloversatilis thermotolerans TaxID=1346290 RepID=UPI00037DD32C|nr:sulfotransferase domain-containing protein [Methyloversatilis thermotolerans]